MDSYFLAQCESSDPNEQLFFAVHVTDQMHKTMRKLHRALLDLNKAGLEVLEIHKLCKFPVWFRGYGELPIVRQIGWPGLDGIGLTSSQFEALMDQIPMNRREQMRLPVIRIGKEYVRWQCRDTDETIYETPIFAIGK